MARFAILLWCIWKSRNGIIFQNAVPNPMGVLIRAKRMWAEWTQRYRNSFLSHSSSTKSFPYPPSSTRLIGWTNPPDGIIKLNFDGSLSSAGAAAGYVLRNGQGQLLQAGTRFMFHAPILVSEATVLRDGIQTTKDIGARSIHIEGDNRMVIRVVKLGIHAPRRIQMLVRCDIQNIPQCFTSVTISHVFREGNLAADWIAKRGVLLKNDVTFFTSPSPEFTYILRDDYAGRTPERRAT